MVSGTVFSLVLHGAHLRSGLRDRQSNVKDEEAKAEKIQFVEMKEPPKVPDSRRAEEVVVKPPPPKGFRFCARRSNHQDSRDRSDQSHHQ